MLFRSFNLENFESLNQKSAREYVNAFAVRAGIRYTIDEKLKLRLGLAYDQTPVADNYLSPDMPDADKMVFACGISYLFSQHFEVDLGYSFENQKEREGTLASENFEGTYKTKQHILGLGINLSF